MSRWAMVKTRSSPRRDVALSRDRIIEASIVLLDGVGESGLTFQALSRRLATGPGAIYWHIDSKSDLLTAACDAVVARTIDAISPGPTPEAAIRGLALGLFDAIDAHPWVGSALQQAPGQLPMLRILERLGQPLVALGVPADGQWTAVSALLSYILGVAGQNAANAQFARQHDLNRDRFLGEISDSWSGLDPKTYPFTRSIAAQLAGHDDRADFLAGIDFILSGIRSAQHG
jgi:AcrR family transcriptional regulator